MYRLSTLHNDLNPEILSKNHEVVFKVTAPVPGNRCFLELQCPVWCWVWLPSATTRIEVHIQEWRLRICKSFSWLLEQFLTVGKKRCFQYRYPNHLWSEQFSKQNTESLPTYTISTNTVPNYTSIWIGFLNKCLIFFFFEKNASSAIVIRSRKGRKNYASPLFYGPWQ